MIFLRPQGRTVFTEQWLIGSGGLEECGKYIQ